MGMANPQSWTYQMMCCGANVPWQPPKPGGAWSGNTWYETESCPNSQCNTNGGPEWLHAPPTWRMGAEQ